MFLGLTVLVIYINIFVRKGFVYKRDVNVSCYRPRLQYNKYLDDMVMVPCRRCPACKQLRSSQLLDNIDRECSLHKYSIFFTLTYDNVHLPLWSVKKFDGYYSLEHNSKVLDVPSDLFLNNVRVMENGKYHFLPDSFASVDVRDIQLFLKRLRSYIKYHFNQFVRYAIVSEYGPHTFRPHYHGILWTDSKEVCNALLDERLGKDFSSLNPLYTCWKMCDFSHIRPQLVKGGASSYVGNYLCCSINLPSILQTKFTRPFFLCSRKPYIGSIQNDEQTLYEMLFNRVVFKNKWLDEEHRFISVPYTLSFLSRHFPLPSGNGHSSNYTKLLLYEKYISGHYSKQSKYNYITPSGNLGDCSPLGKHHLTDAFNYQDYRFSFGVHRYIDRDVIVRKYDSHGFPTNEKVKVRFTAKQYIEALDALYTEYKKYNYVRFLDNLEYCKEKFFLHDKVFLEMAQRYMFEPSQVANLAFYPDVLLSLPKSFEGGERAFYELCPKMLHFWEISPFHLYDGIYNLQLHWDLYCYLAFENPMIRAQRSKSEIKYFKSIIKKQHLSYFNKYF